MSQRIILWRIGLSYLGLVLVCTALLAWLSWRERPDLGTHAPQFPGRNYASTTYESPTDSSNTWSASKSGGGKRGWVLDLFTPPEVFHDSDTGKFTSRPVAASVINETKESPFDLELVEVKREPFRLQLIGHASDARGACGVFENRLTGEVFLARAGRRVPELALRIDAFDIGTESVTSPEGMTVELRLAKATVIEDATSHRVSLQEGESQFSGETVGWVVAKGDALRRKVHSGETIQIGSTSYRVRGIYTDPPRAEVVCTAPFLTTPETRTLSLSHAAIQPASP